MRPSILYFLVTSSCFAAASPDFGRLPIYFKSNVANPQSYQAQGLRYSVSLSPDRASVSLGRDSHRAAVAIEYLNANRHATLLPRDQTPTRASEFIGNDPSRWRRNLPTFARVQETGLYPGIDLVYYGSGKGLEYDFVVAPHSNPDAIRMRVTGAETLSLNAAGELVLHTSGGDLIQHRPEIYQTVNGTRRKVDGAFVIAAGNQVRFRVGRYDRNLPLTIDPQISFSSFLGAYDDDEAFGIAVDNSGNIYVAGYSTSNQFGGDADVMIASINPTGTSMNYITQASGSYGFGGSGDDVANSVAVDGYGSAVVVGSTDSPDFPTSTGAFQAQAPGSYDGFVLRLDPTGQNLIYSTFLGGSGDDEVWSVKIDPVGNTYVTGDTTSTDFPVTAGAYQATNGGAADGFIAKFDNSGKQVWTTYFGGNSDENAYSIAIDPSGNSYVTGFTDSGNFPTLTPYQGTYQGGDDVFVLKMNPTGTQLVYSTFLGSSGDDEGTGITVDAASNAYVVGITTSSGFPVTNGAYQGTYKGGGSDGFVLKMSADGASLNYSTFLGSAGNDEAWAVTVDVSGNAYVVGDTDSDQFPVAGNPQQGARKGGLDGTISELNPTGSGLVYSSYLGGSNDDSVQAIAMDAGGNIYVTGYTSSADFPTVAAGFQNGSGGGPADAFVVKYSFPAILPTVSTSGVVNGASFTPGAAVSPGSIVSIFGSNFANAGVNAQTLPLPTTLGSVSVSINGVAAPLFYVGPTQINAQVPYEVQPGAATLVVTGVAGASSQASFTVAAATPGIFAAGTQAIAQNADGTLNGPNNAAAGGSVVTVYLTGIGPLDNAVATGAAASSSPVSSATQKVTVTINGAPATAQFVGLTPGSVGLAQANIVIPTGLSGNVPLQISIGGAPSNMPNLSVTP